MPTRRALLTLLAAAAATACTSPPAAAVGSIVDVQIVDRSRGELLSTWRHQGASYVAGRPGDRYAVRLTNRSPGRVLVVLSVDGVNAVSGESAAVAQTGYVLAPYQSAEITGWRKSFSEAAAFYFTALPDSYAARTGRPDNVGVIGAAVFRERVPEAVGGWYQPAPSVAKESGAASGRLDAQRQEPAATSADAAAPTREMARRSQNALADEKKLGTGHGEREYSPTSQTAFERASSTPAEVVQVRYDSYANLLASGVIARPRPLPRQPDAFPSFVPDPG
ncbi:MAG TPA: hypothetical protein VGO85_03190 [Caldimonas sp.]|jgi:hypothetical protein|nr:hypothetical protein [Caldimonas sp.]